MTEERTPRDIEERDSDTRPSDSWNPASILPDPMPLVVCLFRWVRTSFLVLFVGTH